MGKLQDIKDQVAREKGFGTWELFTFAFAGMWKQIEPLSEEVARRYAKAVAEDALNRAAESVDAGCELAVLGTEINLDL